MSSAVDDAKEVLSWAMDSGSFDELRKLLLDQLRNDEGLKQYSLELLEGSKTLENVELENTKNKETMNDLKKEIEDKLMSKASTTVWALMDAKDSSASKLIEARVHEGLCEVYERRHAMCKATQGVSTAPGPVPLASQQQPPVAHQPHLGPPNVYQHQPMTAANPIVLHHQPPILAGTVHQPPLAAGAVPHQPLHLLAANQQPLAPHQHIPQPYPYPNPANPLLHQQHVLQQQQYRS